MQVKKRLLFIVTILLNAFTMSAQHRVIFDSDMSSDHDDVGDIALLHAFADLGEIEILACMNSSQNAATPLCMSAINTYFGRPDIPCGNRPDATGGGAYPAQIANEFPHPRYATWNDCPATVDLYRQVLAVQPDKSVVIVTAGYLNNLENLMKSPPDSYSPLTGMELIRKKVKLWACAGGAYPSGDEFNFKVEAAAAAYVVNNWPVAASFVGYDIGQAIVSGIGLAATPADNPIRRVYVDIKNKYPWPTWTQVIMYHAFRGEESRELWDYFNTGRNWCDPTAHNVWQTDGEDPTGDEEQLYLMEVQRYPVQEAIETLVMNSGAPKSRGTVFPPNQPTNLRTTAVTGNRIDLKWTDNSWNETGFVLERKINNGDYSLLVTLNPGVTVYSDENLSLAVDDAVYYRIKALNAAGDSKYTYLRLYDSWTEMNFTNTASTPLYRYYQYGHLRWNLGSNEVDHLVLNNHSTHGKGLTITVDAASVDGSGTFYIYFFHRDKNNWYRLNISENLSKFEKSVNGQITTVGASGERTLLGRGAMMQTWKITVSGNGRLKYYSNNNPKGGAVVESHEVLNVLDNLSFDSGKIGLGGISRQPLWQNFHFEPGEPELNTGIAPVTASNIRLYPNPAGDVIYCSTKVPEIKLFSLQGQCLLSEINTGSLNVRSLPKSLYLVRLKDANGNQQSKTITIQ
jgi:hypothetical protein